jgi:translation initiation factor IF-2
VPTQPPAPPASTASPAAPAQPGAPRPPQGGGQRPLRDLNRPAPRPTGDRPASGGGAPAGGDRGRDGGARRPLTGAGRPLPRPSPGTTAPRPPQQTLRQPKPGEQPKAPPPPAPKGPIKIANIPTELLNRVEGGGPITGKEIEQKLKEQERPHGRAPAAGAPGAPVAPVVDDSDEDDDKKKASGGARRPGQLVGREARHKERNERQAARKGSDTKGRAGSLVLDDRDERHRKGKHLKGRKPKKDTEDRKKDIVLEVPIRVRALSEAIGKRSGEVLFKLMALGAPPTISINSTIEAEMAEMLAADYGIEVKIKREQLPEDKIAEQAADKVEDLEPRAPVVTIMGHVDHGKTSLLDRIRHSNVVDTEAGGITQVIRAWRVEHEGKPITFLDTPGHEAFTKMRARGANVTDIAVIVVAANDGVMPQTEEAISHAKAAEVKIVVAINKVDLPDSNLKKTEQQLYGLGLIPDTMGGDVPFVYTSAKTGKGMDELLESLSLVAELEELKANPNKPAAGTCLEGYLSEKEGVLATILVREGTLRPGDVVLCGATYGTVRKMYNDLGKPIEEAGPTVPVRITGLDEVPNADDPFVVVPDVTTAREIADRRKAKIREQAQAPLSVKRFEDMTATKITELKVILKAEAKGSIEAIRAELDKLKHDEVRVRILWAAIGGITASDIQLALASPQDTLVIGFNAVPDDEARALADERGIQIKQYNIIYQLAGDIRAALEGKLKPREDVIHLGRAVVRETFKISRVGTIAGCYVTQGVIERSAKVRVIRGGVVIYPPADRTVGLESLKRFKEDAREVREGFECGLKVAGYDDIKVDDVIEAYRIEQVQRTLS